MRSATRLGDYCSGHGCYPPRPNIEGSPNVYVNNRASHRQTDGWADHVCGNERHVGAKTSTGSSSVYVNGLQAARLGDPIDCGSACIQGSPNTFIGG